jgi:hypothetical protein
MIKHQGQPGEIVEVKTSSGKTWRSTLIQWEYSNRYGYVWSARSDIQDRIDSLPAAATSNYNGRYGYRQAPEGQADYDTSPYADDTAHRGPFQD